MLFFLIVFSYLLTACYAEAPGYIYALSNNGSTNEWNFIVADLLTFEVLPRGDPIIDAEALGQAALVIDTTFYSMLLVRDPTNSSNDKILLTGIETSTGKRVINYDTRAWPNVLGRGFFIEALFSSNKKPGFIFVVGRSLGQPEQLLIDLDTSSGITTLRGIVNCSGGDITWNEIDERLYETITDGNDEDSGSLIIISTSTNGSSPSILSTFALEDHFGFSMFDPLSKNLFGLTLQTGGVNGYMRNFTALSTQDKRYNATSHGDLGELYVVLEDGPKAFDTTTRRAFFMLASGPFAEFEITAIDVDSIPVKILETPGLCGFIGYCPQAFAFGSR